MSTPCSCAIFRTSGLDFVRRSSSAVAVAPSVLGAACGGGAGAGFDSTGGGGGGATGGGGGAAGFSAAGGGGAGGGGGAAASVFSRRFLSRFCSRRFGGRRRLITVEHCDNSINLDSVALFESDFG